MTPDVIAAFKAHAEAEYPREACGVIVRRRKGFAYVPCRNAHPDPTSAFKIDKKDYEAAGNVVAIAHSHPDDSAEASESDLRAIEITDLPWFIVSTFRDLLGDGSPLSGDVLRYDPRGYRTPLLGRPFVHGDTDCYGLIRDFFSDAHGISLPDFEREDCWWEDKDSPSLYLAHFKDAGFYEVPLSDMRPSDVILMEVRSMCGPNHAAVYMGENKIIHHLYGRPSCEAVYGGAWLQYTRMVVRHKDMK